jgi:hypothetical protein
MKMRRLIILFIFYSFLFSQNILRDDFENLDNWKPLTFKKIAKHTRYTIVAGNPHGFVLKANSDASASGLVWNESFNVKESPILRWKWKVSNVYSKGNAKMKSGDDYPIRIYVMFEYDPETAGFWETALYESVKLIYGEYPPHSSLNYIWANKDYKEDIISNSYTDKAQMILLQKGSKHVGEWMVEEVNIPEDYQRAFGKTPPKKASLAIMSDSDNTGEAATVWVDFIELTK